MKYKVLVFSVLVLFTACNKPLDNFSKYEWKIKYHTYDENQNIIIKEHVSLRNDSSISLIGPGVYKGSPIIRKDSLLICRWYYDADSTYVDTSRYDFKLISGFPTLIIKNGKDPIILKCNNPDQEFTETNYFFEMITFKIGGYTIGDTITMDMLENIVETDDYNCPGLLTGNIKGNENILIDILAKKYIYRIRQLAIDEGSIDDIISVVENKIINAPDSSFFEDSFSTYINYQDFGTNIELHNQDVYSYYMKKAEEEDFPWAKEILLNLAAENISSRNEYELEYNNSIIQEILRNNIQTKPVSSIIE